MKIWELIVVAVGLSMDAFAVAVSKGLSFKKLTAKGVLIVALYFGVFQGLMPLIGFFVASQFADLISSVDHWIAFLLLVAIGGKMIFESFKKEGCSDRICPTEQFCTDRQCPLALAEQKRASLKFLAMLPLAVATSIDALAVGVTFAFLQTDIWQAVLIIGVTTFLLSAVGVLIGSLFGSKLKSKAEFFGGLILVLMGVKILLEHLGIF